MKPMVIAHRGVSLNEPENTLPAFNEAFRLGADGIETDVQLTRDGKPVIHHNYTIDACSNGVGRICDLTLKELLRYDFGEYRGDKYRGTQIATLAEMLTACKDFKIIDFELKAPMNKSCDFVKSIVGEVTQQHLEKKVIISAFDHSLLAEVKELCPTIRTGALLMPTNFSEGKMLELLRKFLPPDRVLADTVVEDLASMPKDETDPATVGIPGKSAADAVAELARQIGAVYPGYNLGEACEALEKQKDIVNYICGLDPKPDFLHCHYYDVLKHPELPKKMRELNVGCNPWTADDPLVLQLLINAGCDGIITNRPDLLLGLLTK